MTTKEIGGYFGLELSQGEHYHKGALYLNSARSCLEYILRVRQYQKVYIPYYTCEVIIEPFKKLDIQYEFYHINELLEPCKVFSLGRNEAFLYTNYFGLKQDCVARLARVYKKKLIVDNAQAFYAKPMEGIDTFYSPRKFFGVPDGGYLYIDKSLDIELEQDYSCERMAHLMKRIDVSAKFGYDDFKRNDDGLKGQPIKLMSRLTSSILSSVDYRVVGNRRIENFLYLDSCLKDRTLFKYSMGDDDVPMIYPYYVEGNELKSKLIANNVFVATYWPNVGNWCDEMSYELMLTRNLLCMPIDQRYGTNEMQQIVDIIQCLTE